MNRIEYLRDFPDLIPVRRDNLEQYEVKVVNRAHHVCKNYLSTNRRGFYKIVFLKKGKGQFTLGLNEYIINEPSIIFIHPDEIISWKNLAQGEENTGYFLLFKERFLRVNAGLSSAVSKFGYFKTRGNNVIQLSGETIEEFDQLFAKMFSLGNSDEITDVDNLQVYVQLILTKSSKGKRYTQPTLLNDDHRHVYRFFDLLESETSQISVGRKLHIKTAQEFADQLNLHPNYLNSLLKRKTGQNLKVHIKGRLLEEGKLMLLYTNYSVQEIGEAIGFKNQSNFSRFFKTQSGLSPQEYREYASLEMKATS